MKKIIMVFFVCMNSLGYGADFNQIDFMIDQLEDGEAERSFEADEILSENAFICLDKDCSQSFLTQEDLEVHEINVHGQLYSAATEFPLDYDVANDEMVIPPQDGLDFQKLLVVSPSSPVQRSMDVQAGKTICAMCGRDCGFPSNLIAHMRVHSGEKPFVCSDNGCGKAFARKFDLKRHNRTHTREKPFFCYYKRCGKLFSQKPNLKMHMKIHTGDSPYHCEECDKNFSAKSSLKRHQKAVHKKPN
jgi:hypothetical protein